MKNKTVALKCRRFDHNWVIDRATSMWFDVESINRQIAITPEHMRSVRYNRLTRIDWVSGCSEDYGEYFLDKVTLNNKTNFLVA